MTDITLTDTQGAGIKKIILWYMQCQKELGDGKPLTQQVFRLFGFAGVGKSTLLKYAIDELKSKLKNGSALNILYACATGKAALVITRKGTPATTIHAAIYCVQEHSKEAIEKAKQELAKLREGDPGETDGMLWRAMLRTREEAIKDMHHPSFVLNPDSPMRDADMIVLDEVSMVGDQMAADLMSFGKPILVLGDPGQLPPIKGEGAFTQASPDVMLTEIHRQAEDSAIIRLATMARQGKFIPYGEYSDTVFKMHRNELSEYDLLNADQVLCGLNATRLMINNAMRGASGHTTIFPDGPSEKVICLRNRNDLGLVNGAFLTLKDVDEAGEYGFRAEIKTDDGVKLGRLTIYKGHFLDHVQQDKDREYKDKWHKRGMIEATYGSAITVHKSQGSQFSNVIWVDDGWGRGEDRNRHAYTAITRAEEGLVILA